MYRMDTRLRHRSDMPAGIAIDALVAAAAGSLVLLAALIGPLLV